MGAGVVRVTLDGASRWRRRSGEYTTMAEALAAAEAGDTVAIGPGVFRENVVIDKPLKVRAAEGPGTVRIEPAAGTALTRELIASERKFIHVLLRDGKITDESRRRIERDLDLEEASLRNREYRTIPL